MNHPDSTSSFLALFIFGLGLLFAVSNGFRNGSVVVSVLVSSRAVTPSKAFYLCALSEFLGALFIGTAVAATIAGKMYGEVLVQPQHEGLLVLGCGMGSAIIWSFVGWKKAWPISNRHALFAGLAGAGWAAWGLDPFQNRTLMMLFFVLIAGPLLAMFISFGVSRLVGFLGQYVTSKAAPFFEQVQTILCMGVAVVDGSSVGQIVIGYAVLVAGFLNQLGPLGSHSIDPSSFRFRLIVAVAVGVGVLLGGNRNLHNVGMKFFRIQLPQAISAQITSSGLVLGCLALGYPASTTHVISGSVLGAGVAKNPRLVKWSMVGEVALSWVLTIPAAAFLSFVLYKGLIMIRTYA